MISCNVFLLQAFAAVLMPATPLRSVRRCGGRLIGASLLAPTRVSLTVQGFGRRERLVSTEDVQILIFEQVEALRTLACEVGLPVRFLKPHGALYNQAQFQEPVAHGVLLAAGRLDVPLLGQPGTLLERLAREQGVRYIPEGFPDRRYSSPVALVSRTELGALLHDPDEIELQLIRLVEEGRVATLCVHGDEPRAVSNADLVRRILDRNGILMRSFLEPN